MWKFFKPRSKQKTQNQTDEDRYDLVRQYGSVLVQESETTIRDESLLPGGKSQLKEALACALAVAQNEQEREALRIAFVALADFQPGIGNPGINLRRIEDFDRFEAVEDEWTKAKDQLKTELSAIEDMLKKRGIY